MAVKRKRSVNYVDPVELLEEVKNYRSTGVCSNRLGKLLLLMATNFASKGNWSGYTWKQDMISEAVLTCVKYLQNFNPEKSSNAFSYVTQILGNAFKLTIINEKKHIHIKNICHQATMLTPFMEESSYSEKSLDYASIQNRVAEDQINTKEKPNYLWVEPLQQPQNIVQ